MKLSAAGHRTNVRSCSSLAVKLPYLGKASWSLHGTTCVPSCAAREATRCTFLLKIHLSILHVPLAWETSVLFLSLSVAVKNYRHTMFTNICFLWLSLHLVEPFRISEFCGYLLEQPLETNMTEVWTLKIVRVRHFSFCCPGWGNQSCIPSCTAIIRRSEGTKLAGWPFVTLEAHTFFVFWHICLFAFFRNSPSLSCKRYKMMRAVFLPLETILWARSILTY